MSAPEYSPNRDSNGNPKFEIGKSVRFDRQNGQSHVGRISNKTLAGNYEIEDDQGNQFHKQATELEPVGDSTPTIPSSDTQSAMLQQSKQGKSQPPGGDAVEGNQRQQSLPPVPEEHHRFWHGGAEYKGGSRFLSPDYDFAKGYADKSGGYVHYVDVPRNSPHLKKAFDDSGSSVKAPFVSFEAPESIAKHLSRADTSGQNPASPPVQKGGSALDKGQTILDGVGFAGDAVIPGSGVAADGTNAVISLLRAATDRKNAGEHLKNAAISTVSMVPFVGDLAKGLKYNRKRGSDDGENVNDGNGGGDGPPDSPSGSPGSDGGDPLEQKATGTRDKVLWLAGAAGKAAGATILAANSMSLLNKTTIEYNRDLVKYNGMISEAYGKLETDRAARSIKQGGELSGPLSGLVESQSRLEDKLQDFQSPWKVIAADIMRVLTEILGIAVATVDLLEPISEIYVEYIRPLLVKMKLLKAADIQSPSTGWFDKIQKQSEENSKKPRKV